MNVLEISPLILGRLLAASAVCGAAVSALYLLTGVIIRVLSYVGRHYPSPGTVCRLLRSDDNDGRRGRRVSVTVFTALRDFILCTLSVILLLCINVIYNNGDFRLFTLAGFALAAFLWKAVLGFASSFLMFYVFYTLKVFIMLLVMPLKLVIKYVIIVFNIIAKCLIRLAHSAEVASYTKKSTAYARKAASDGLLTTSPKQ